VAKAKPALHLATAILQESSAENTAEQFAKI
jgi:hypothetical protein